MAPPRVGIEPQSTDVAVGVMVSQVSEKLIGLTGCRVYSVDIENEFG